MSAPVPRFVFALLFGAAVSGCATARAARAEPGEKELAETTVTRRGDRVVVAGDNAAAKLDAFRRSATVLATATGEATYYADKFDGRLTASGIVFQNSEPYAAHRTYPFGTIVRVTNLANDRSVVLNVVDRGPHGTAANAARTIIDVSRSAAESLDFVHAGRIEVRVEVLRWGDGRTNW